VFLSGICDSGDEPNRLFYLISLVILREMAGGIQYPAWQKGCDSDPLMLLYIIAWQV
jgi:hypothetical protein